MIYLGDSVFIQTNPQFAKNLTYPHFLGNFALRSEVSLMSSKSDLSAFLRETA